MEQANSNNAPRQAQTVMRKHWYVPVLLVSLAVLFFAGSWYGQRKSAGPKAADGRRILHYVDPMNPAHTSPEPGLAPCGMKMEPVYADDKEQAYGLRLAPGSVKISPEKQQIIGVQMGTVEKSPFTYALRTVGRVSVDDNLAYRLNAFIDGWIVEINNNTTSGNLVRRGEPLATYFNRDLPSTLQTFYYSLDTLELMKKDPNLSPSQRNLLLAQKLTSEGVLMNLGMTKVQIDELIHSRKLTQEITINAPATSIVLTRNITIGQRFTAGEELLRLADLSRVWILADLYENESKYIKPGEKVSVTMPDQVEKRTATVSTVLPLFDPTTLTLKVRLEMDNPKFTLRPGMFTDVEFPIKMPPSINVPRDAIMDSGRSQTVFVDRGDGFFEPRRVKIGWRLGDRVQILDGLKPGERIVISGNFLIDSESRMKLAAAGMFGQVNQDPVCGLNVDESKATAAGFVSTYKTGTYYFCSEGCKQHFDKNPERFAEKKAEVKGAGDEAAGSKQLEPATAKDIVCGKEVKISQAKAEGLTSKYQGKTYYFSSYACNHEFDKDPERYISQAGTGDQTKAIPEMANDTACEMPKAAAAPHQHEHMDSQAKPEVKEAGSEAAGPKQLEPDTAKDIVCGKEVKISQAKAEGLTSKYQGKTYFFSSYACNHKFDKDPERYISQAGTGDQTRAIPEMANDTACEMPKTATAPHHHEHMVSQAKPEATPGRAHDPVCGLTAAIEVSKQAGLTSEYQGKTYYFDTPGCKQRFDNNPHFYASGGAVSILGPPVEVRTYPKTPLGSDSTLHSGEKIMQGRPPGPLQAAPQIPAPAIPFSGVNPMPQAPAMPPAAAQIVPQASPQTPLQSPAPAAVMPPGAEQTCPQAPPQMPQKEANQPLDYKQNLLRRIQQAPAKAHRSALAGQGQKEAQMQPQATIPAAPPVKPQEQQTPPIQLQPQPPAAPMTGSTCHD